MFLDPSKSRGLKLQPLMVWCGSCCSIVQYMVHKMFILRNLSMSLHTKLKETKQSSYPKINFILIIKHSYEGKLLAEYFKINTEMRKHVGNN